MECPDSVVTGDGAADDYVHYDVDGNYDVRERKGSCGISYINCQHVIITFGTLSNSY